MKLLRWPLVFVLLLGTAVASSGDILRKQISWRQIYIDYQRARMAYIRGDIKSAQRHYAKAARLPQGTPASQRAALERVNYHRLQAMLVPVMPSLQVARAAKAHANYLRLHTTEGALSLAEAHREKPGRKGFTGEGVGDRLAKQGFYGGSTEVVSAVTEPEEAVDHLINTVYHRGGLLRPEARYAGFGASSRTVIDLAWKSGSKAETDWVFYPGDWQKDVPPRFPGGETPEPLPGQTYPVGPPISVGGGEAAPKLLKAFLKGPKGKIALKLLNAKNAPSSAMLGKYIYLVPLSPLEENSRYQCSVKVKTKAGIRQRSWGFRTGDEVPGEELWQVKITKLNRQPQRIVTGRKVRFSVDIEANRPDEVSVRWSINGKKVKDGSDRFFQWRVPDGGTHLIDAYAYYPKNPEAFGRRCLQISVPGSSMGPTNSNQGLRDPSRGNKAIAVKLEFQPSPAWKKGTKVKLIATTSGIEGKATYSFSCDGRVFASSSKPRALWIADGKIAHVFSVKVEFAAGSVTRTVTFSQQ